MYFKIEVNLTFETTTTHKCFFLNRACYAQRFEPLQNRHILQPGCLLGENNSCQSAAAKLGK